MKQKVHILVAEDNQINQLLMKTVLDMEGFTYCIVENGLIATEKFQEEKFDIILMDLMMPVMNGYEATSVIRNIIGSNIPIIAVSADVTADVKEKCLAVGMNDYISKPFKAEELIEKIKKLIDN
jgi:CheY-like chemotaxis protein